MALIEENLGLQFWHKRMPSQREALLVLEKTLDLLSEALPIALRAVGSNDVQIQQEFWRSFCSFDSQTDISMTAVDYKYDEYPIAIGKLLEDWREVVEHRAAGSEEEL